jgi:hypothetical protein
LRKSTTHRVRLINPAFKAAYDGFLSGSNSVYMLR